MGSILTDFYTRCGLRNLNVTLVEKVKVKTEKYLDKREGQREGHWQRQLSTMYPMALTSGKNSKIVQTSHFSTNEPFVSFLLF